MNLIKFFIKKLFGLFDLKISKVSSQHKYFTYSNFPVVEAEKKIVDAINVCKSFSMTGELRMYVLSQAIEYIYKKKLEGDFVECGVWRGGNLMLMNKLNDFYSLEKIIYGFDTFEGMTSPNNYDVDYKNISASSQMNSSLKSKDLKNVHCYSPIEEVINNIKNYSNINNVKLIKGRVEETLLNQNNLPKKISLLRLDTDFYDSTLIELKLLYPLLVQGGVLIIDDYGHWKGCKKAVDEYFKNTYNFFHYIDHTARMIIKD
jgi:O-methyltransferase